MAKLHFHQALLQSSMSHYHSEMLILCSRNISFYRKLPYIIIFEIEIFCNIRHVFTVALDEFNVSFLNKSINFFKEKNLTNPIFLTVVFVFHTTPTIML